MPPDGTRGTQGLEINLVAMLTLKRLCKRRIMIPKRSCVRYGGWTTAWSRITALRVYVPSMHKSIAASTLVAISPALFTYPLPSVSIRV